MARERNMMWHEAVKEVTFIQSINPRNPGQSFNHDPACFEEYRAMQSHHARRSGHDLQADQMLMNAWG